MTLSVRLRRDESNAADVCVQGLRRVSKEPDVRTNKKKIRHS